MAKYISGVILYDETIRQNAKDGTPLVKLIEKAGAIPGIKVDKGTKPLPFCANEVVTEGLDGLRERLVEYRGLGARFAKWRAVIDIGERHVMPSYTCVKANAHALARYAALCQDEDIVPIVEPEVLMDGDHDIDRCAEVTEWVLKETFQELFYNRVALEGMVLKPNMAVPGKKSAKRASVAGSRGEDGARAQGLRAGGRSRHRVPLRRPVRRGGDRASRRHQQIGPLPWRVTFSYGRALQAAPQKAWSGKPENVAAAQRAFGHRAAMNGLAALGQWQADLERKAA